MKSDEAENSSNVIGKESNHCGNMGNLVNKLPAKVKSENRLSNLILNYFISWLKIRDIHLDLAIFLWL